MLVVEVGSMILGTFVLESWMCHLVFMSTYMIEL